MRLVFALTALLVLLFPSFVSGSNIGLIENSTWGQNLTGVVHGSLVLGDLDNDGDLDLVITGCSSGGLESCVVDKARVYINNGTSMVENSTWQHNLTGIGWSSIALGDIDNDGDLDLVASGSIDGSNGFHVKTYINNGTSLGESFSWEQSLKIDAYAGAVALGDIDNDGDLDLALVGASANGNGIYLNNGTSFVKDPIWIEPLPIVGHGLDDGGHIALGDLDNDERLDILMVGSKSTNFYRGVYINNGTSLVENSSWEQGFSIIFGESQHSIAIGNWNNDDFLDFACIGLRAGDHFYIYQNHGAGFTANTTEDSGGSACMPGYYDGSIAWGDYTTDGKLDIAAIGMEKGRASIIERDITNPWGCTFANDASARSDISQNMVQGSIAWGDIDTDGDLDLVVTGDDDVNEIAKIYINNITTPNNNPDPPMTDTMNMSYTDSRLIAKWGYGSDMETPSPGLYYNLRIGPCSDCHDIVTGIYGGADTNGYFGNMMQRKGITLNRQFDPGTKIYWAVQTIDTGLAKSAWSQEQVYTIPAVNPPSIINVRNGSVIWNLAQILFETDIEGNATVYYGVNQDSLNLSASNSTLTFGHSLGLTGLTENTAYYYNVTSCNEYGCNTSGTYNFTTGTCIPAWYCSSWASCEPDNTQRCNQWVDANNCGKSYSGSNTKSCTYSSSGDGVSSYTPPQKNYTFDRIEAGSPMKKEITDGISIRIDVRKTVSGVYVRINRLLTKPASVPPPSSGEVYEYLEINTSGIADEDIKEAFIEFTVNKSWVIEKNFDSENVTLQRYHQNKWQVLDTRFLDVGDRFLNYMARTPGFSYFAVVGQKREGPATRDNATQPQLLCNPGSRRCFGDELQECNPTGTVWIAREVCLNGCDSAAITCNPPPDGDTSWYYIVISVMATAVITLVYLANKKFGKTKILEDAYEEV